MHIRILAFTNERSYASGGDRNVCYSGHGHDAQCVPSRLLEDGIATYSRNSDKLNLGTSVSEHQRDCIIMTGVTVEDNLAHCWLDRWGSWDVVVRLLVGVDGGTDYACSIAQVRRHYWALQIQLGEELGMFLRNSATHNHQIGREEHFDMAVVPLEAGDPFFPREFLLHPLACSCM